MSRRRDLSIVLAVWVLLQGVCWWQTGVRVVGDAPRYLGGAEALLAGEALPPAARPYAGTAAVFAALLATGGGIGAIVAGQIALSGIALCAFHAVATRLYSPRAGLFAGVLLAGWWEIQRRNFFLLTTSLFVSFTVLALAAVLVARRKRGLVGAGALLAVVALLRPEGVLVAVAAVVYWLRRLLLQGRRRAAAALGLAMLLVGAAAAPAAAEYAARIELGRHYLEGTVIWGHEDSRIEPAATVPRDPELQTSPLRALAWMASKDPLRLGRVAAAKLARFLVHTKPYYSVRHNLFILLTLFPLYALALAGARRSPRIAAARWLLGALLVGECLFVVATFEDWSGRWLLHVTPALLLLAGAGADGLEGSRRSSP